MLKIWHTTILAGFVWLVIYVAFIAALGLSFGTPAMDILRKQLNHPGAYFGSAITSAKSWTGPTLVARFKSNRQTLKSLLSAHRLKPAQNLECRQLIAQNLPFFLLWGPVNPVNWKCLAAPGKTSTLYMVYQSEQHFVYLYLRSNKTWPESSPTHAATP